MRNFLLIFPFLIACGASGIEIQARAAVGTREVLDLAGSAIEVVCDPSRVETARLRDKCLKAIEGHDTSRAAWGLWRDAILVAASSDDPNALAIALSFVGPILDAYGEVQEFLQEFNVTLPSLPIGGPQ